MDKDLIAFNFIIEFNFEAGRVFLTVVGTWHVIVTRHTFVTGDYLSEQPDQAPSTRWPPAWAGRSPRGSTPWLRSCWPAGVTRDTWHVTRDVVITPHCAGSGVTRACVSPTPWGRWCTAAGAGRGRGPGRGAGASWTSSGAASPRSWGSSACGSTCSMVLSSFPWPSSSCSAFYSSTGPSQIHHHFFHIKATLVSRTLIRTCHLFYFPLQTTPVQSWWIHTMEKFIKQVKSHNKANTQLIPPLYRTLLRWPCHLHMWLWSPACRQWGARLPGDWPLVWVRAILQEARWAEELTSDQVSRGPTQTRHNRLILTQICQTNKLPSEQGP